jgi:hypothetical protein
LYRSLGPGNGKPPLQNLPHHAHINPTRNRRQGLQRSNSQGRIMEFGPVISPVAPLAQRMCKGSETKSALASFHRIYAPMHASRSAVSWMIMVIPGEPKRKSFSYVLRQLTKGH